MSVFREVTIDYGGASYTFTPSNRMLRRIDAELSPQTLLGVLNVMDGNQVPLPALALVISEMVKEGGGDVTEDDVLVELYRDVQQNEGKGIKPLVQVIGACVTPPSDLPGGNGGSPAKASGKKARKTAA